MVEQSIPPDKIRLLGLCVPCIIGVSAEERRHAQEIILDLTLFAELKSACRSDDIRDTVDYRNLEEKIMDFIKKTRFFLLEKLADSIAGMCFNEPLVQQVKIRITKPSAPLQAKFVSVEISRRREDYE